jgi:superfamily II DNA/RNA helicase
MDQMSRTATLDAFREGRISLLAASDVAARGLDIPEVSHIFNFDVPWHSDDYVHRIGRTGRAGKEGRSLTLVTPEDGRQLKDIERMLGTAIHWIGHAPSDAELTPRRRQRGRGAPMRGGRMVRGLEPRPARHAEPGTANGATGPHGTPGPLRPPGPHASPRGRTERKPERLRSGGGQERAKHANEGAKPREPGPAAQAGRAPERVGGSRDGAGARVAQRPPRKGHPDGDAKSAPIGLGDHVPAFLKKAVRQGT